MSQDNPNNIQKQLFNVIKIRSLLEKLEVWGVEIMKARICLTDLFQIYELYTIYKLVDFVSLI